MAIVQRKGGVDARRNELRRMMNTLAIVGDLVELQRGQWLSASGCIVRLDGTPTPTYLLISGIPLREFDEGARATVAVDGTRRIIRDVGSVSLFGLPVIEYQNWARTPRTSLQDWTCDTLALPLRRQNDEWADACEMQLYAPQLAALHKPQAHRWTSVDRSSDGRTLARLTMFGDPIYAVVDVARGAVAGRRECAPHDVRRLMYGLDQQHENPTSVTVVDRAGTTSVRLRNALPYAEARGLLALVEDSADARPLVTRHGAAVRAMLDGLGIHVSDGGGAESG
ncbi:hypothetical protein [Rhodococcus sp. IEGM 1379]|uniref:hypothetical protein n=1 Tax=Rhodococcus sp. IEGM 1379 TaxID=3047086 RepID=UPI0024B7EEC8|nr:hypothetical protein [Rhodococcus sp. IEGM 1379]MDI9914751.1 hypothetical protein [Rhodococcus sp. IEGM 1379]